MRGVRLPLVAVLLVAVVLGFQVAAGGGTYVPRRPANPCTQRPVPPIPPRLKPLAAQIVLLGLSSAACRLGISGERLVLNLAEARSLDPRAAAALKAGLRDAVDILNRGGRLPRVSQLLPDALDQVSLPGLAKTIIEAIPAGLVDSTLPTAPLLQRTIDQLNVTRLVHDLKDPGQINSVVESAILHAALGLIINRLAP